MRRFSFNVDLRKKKGVIAVPAKAAAPARDGLAVSESLGRHRRNMREWGNYQRALRALPQVSHAAEHFEDAELAEEYVRIYGVTREKILEAAPGFDTEGKTELHCFFEEDGSKHVISRLIALPNARVTELSMFATGEVTRVYYERAGGGPEQALDELYEQGLAGLEEDVSRFARFPNYVLKFVLLPCEKGRLVDIFKGTCYYDEATGSVATEEDENLGS